MGIVALLVGLTALVLAVIALVRVRKLAPPNTNNVIDVHSADERVVIPDRPPGFASPTFGTRRR